MGTILNPTQKSIFRKEPRSKSWNEVSFLHRICCYKKCVATPLSAFFPKIDGRLRVMINKALKED